MCLCVPHCSRGELYSNFEPIRATPTSKPKAAATIIAAPQTNKIKLSSRVERKTFSCNQFGCQFLDIFLLHTHTHTSKQTNTNTEPLTHTQKLSTQICLNGKKHDFNHDVFFSLL